MQKIVNFSNYGKVVHDVEQNVRNFAAHEIVSVTEEWIEKEQV